MPVVCAVCPRLPLMAAPAPRAIAGARAARGLAACLVAYRASILAHTRARHAPKCRARIRSCAFVMRTARMSWRRRVSSRMRFAQISQDCAKRSVPRRSAAPSDRVDTARAAAHRRLDDRPHAGGTATGRSCVYSLRPAVRCMWRARAFMIALVRNSRNRAIMRCAAPSLRLAAITFVRSARTTSRIRDLCSRDESALCAHARICTLGCVCARVDVCACACVFLDTVWSHSIDRGGPQARRTLALPNRAAPAQGSLGRLKRWRC